MRARAQRRARLVCAACKAKSGSKVGPLASRVPRDAYLQPCSLARLFVQRAQAGQRLAAQRGAAQADSPEPRVEGARQLVRCGASRGLYIVAGGILELVYSGRGGQAGGTGTIGKAQELVSLCLTERGLLVTLIRTLRHGDSKAAWKVTAGKPLSRVVLKGSDLRAGPTCATPSRRPTMPETLMGEPAAAVTEPGVRTART